LRDKVVDCLAFVAVDGFCGNDGARVHDGAAEEGLAFVRVVAVVEDHLVEDADCAGAFAPDGDFGRVAAERCDVVGYPLETQSLIEQPEIGRSIFQDLLSGQEAKAAEAVVDCYEDDGFALGYRFLDEGCAIVHCGPTKFKAATKDPEHDRKLG